MINVGKYTYNRPMDPMNFDIVSLNFLRLCKETSWAKIWWWTFLQWKIHPGRLTWNLPITHLERKMIFQTSMIMFHLDLQGCIRCNKCRESYGAMGMMLLTVYLAKFCVRRQWKVRNWVVVSNIFYFYPYLGKIPILTSIFFKGVETTN